MNRLQSYIEFGRQSMSHIPQQELVLPYLLTGLSSEVGEVLGEYKKYLKNQTEENAKHRADNMKAELGDVLWYLVRTIDHLGYTVEELMDLNQDKLTKRLAERAKKRAAQVA